MLVVVRGRLLLLLVENGVWILPLRPPTSSPPHVFCALHPPAASSRPVSRPDDMPHNSQFSVTGDISTNVCNATLSVVVILG